MYECKQNSEFIDTQSYIGTIIANYRLHTAGILLNMYF